VRYNRQMNFSPRPSSEPIIYPVEVVLASQSVGRRLLLEKLGIRFRVIATHVNEEGISDTDPIRKLTRRAEAKANEIALHPRIYSLSELAKTLVIAADTEAIVGKKAFGKATDRENAKQIVKDLMGKTHTVATAVTVVLMDKGKEVKRWNKVVTSKVTLRKLTNPEIDLYTARYDLTRFSAGYAVTETPWDIITKIEGSFTNVVGLPFEFVLPIFKTHDIIALPKNLV
jgi:septum formation protein